MIMPEWLDVALRSILMIVGIFLLVRLLGKKQLSEMSFFEYITGITIGSIAGVLSLDRSVPVLYGFISIAIWVLIPLIFNLLMQKSKKVRDVVEGKATVFIKDGKILEENLKKEHYTTENLLYQLRKKDIFNIADVEFAVLETDGSLSVLKKKEKQPVTLKDMNLPTNPEKEPQTVIMDGKIIDEALKNSGLNRAWLKTELEKLGVAVENVFLGQVDSMGQLTVDLYADKITVPEPVEKPLLLATMKKCQADLELFALATKDQKAKEMYAKHAEKIEQLIQQVEPVLR